MYVVIQFGKFYNKIINLGLIDGGIKSYVSDKNFIK